jgi:hypothetical protein
LFFSVAAGTAGGAGSRLIFGSLGRGLIGVSLEASNHPRWSDVNGSTPTEIKIISHSNVFEAWHHPD